MTPFGKRVRELRARRGISLKAMAADLGVSSAYLSALEHGRRGRPGPGLVMEICASLDLIWDDAEELKRLAAQSHPRAVIDTAGLSPRATELANLLAETVHELDDETLDWIIAEIRARVAPPKGPAY